MRFALGLLLPLLAACTPPPDFAAQSDVVLIGEVHGVADHHAFQAEEVARLQPAAIVFEQVQGADTARLNGLLRRGASTGEIAERLQWADSGWPDFALYHQIMRAAPGAQVVGGGAPVELVRRASVQGAESVFGADAALYGLDKTLPPAQRATRELEQFAVHCEAVPLSAMPGFVEAQRFRDARLAQAVLLARERVNGGQVVLITGNGHARVDWGVPAALATAAPELTTFSIGQVGPGDTAPFNDVRVADLPDQGDPCAAFAEGGT